jgi:hypothetical protein
MEPLDTDEQHQRMVLEAYARTFNTPYGELVLDDLAKSCYLHKSTFVSGDPHMTALNEGQRMVVLLIIAALQRASNPGDDHARNYTGDPSDGDNFQLYFSPGGRA